MGDDFQAGADSSTAERDDPPSLGLGDGLLNDLPGPSRLAEDALESLEEGILVVGRHGEVLFANEAVARIMGTTREHLGAASVNSPVADAFYADGTAVAMKTSLTKSVLASGAPESLQRMRFVTSDGDDRWVDVSATPLTEPGGSAPYAVLYACRDVTERHRVETALSESDARFHEVANSVSAVFWSRDLDSGALIYVSSAYEEIFGRPREDLTDSLETWLEAVHPDDREAVRQAARLDGPQDGDQEYRIVRPDGEVRWIRERRFPQRPGGGGVRRVTGMSEDVTDLRATETALAEARDRSLKAFLHAPTGSVIFDVAEPNLGLVLEVNPAFCAMVGLPAETLLGMTSAALLHDADRAPGVHSEWPLLMSGEVDSFRIERRLTHAAGHTIEARLQISLIRDADGAPLYGLAQVEDVTASKRAELQQEAIAQLGQTALAALDLDGLMHEALEVVTDTLGMAIGGALQRLPEGREFAIRASVGIPKELQGDLRIPIAENSQAGHTIRERHAIVVEDWETETRFAPAPIPRQLGVLSGITAVIEGARCPWGVITVQCMDRRRYAPDEINFVQSVANVLATAVQRWMVEEETRHRALHDPLTGLPNRTLFLDRLAHALDRASRTGNTLAVLFIDLDNFKVVNDSLGHQLGDDLLMAVAPRLQAALRPADTIARFGGDEFVVLCEDLAGEADAIYVAGRILGTFERPIEIGENELFTSATIGLALARDADSPTTLIRDADAAMYRAKARGRGRFEVFDDEMRLRVSERLKIENDLRRALATDSLELFFQPIVSLQDGAVLGAEALLRWHDEERGWIPPSDFIPIAEESGLIVAIGDWVLREAARVALTWPAAGPGGTPLEVAVNISARQVAQADFGERLQQILAETGLPASRLALEITESVLLEETDAPLEMARRIKATGASLVLDDFGTGYSSLSYLNRLPIDVLKLDRSFIAPISGDKHTTTSAIVAGVLTMAHALGMKVVAEGVEEEGQRDQLKVLGCPLAQGYLFARPMPAADLERYLRALS